MAGTLTIGGLAAGLLTGQKVIGPVTMTGSAVIGTVTDLTLASGDNTIAVPAGATAVMIELPASSVVELKLRTNLNSSDAGTPFGPSGFVVLPVYSGTTSLIVNAASGGGTIEASFI
jgi:hypothetical protein